MADDIAITPGSGASVATDDAGGRHVQLFKLAYSANGVATLVEAGASGLYVAMQRRPASAATLSSVNDTGSSASLLASNSSRLGVVIHNNSSSTLYLKYGATASLTSYTYMIPASATWEMPEPIYTGAIDGIWDVDGSGVAYITELS